MTAKQTQSNSEMQQRAARSIARAGMTAEEFPANFQTSVGRPSFSAAARGPGSARPMENRTTRRQSSALKPASPVPSASSTNQSSPPLPTLEGALGRFVEVLSQLNEERRQELRGVKEAYAELTEEVRKERRSVRRLEQRLSGIAWLCVFLVHYSVSRSCLLRGTDGRCSPAAQVAVAICLLAALGQGASVASVTAAAKSWFVAPVYSPAANSTMAFGSSS